MQATWIRMQLGKPDNIQVFRPFQYGPLSKVKFFNQMMIGLDTPRYDTSPRLSFPHRCHTRFTTSAPRLSLPHLGHNLAHRIGAMTRLTRLHNNNLSTTPRHITTTTRFATSVHSSAGLVCCRYMGGAELQGDLSASVTFSAWLKMVIRVTDDSKPHHGSRWEREGTGGWGRSRASVCDCMSTHTVVFP